MPAAGQAGAHIRVGSMNTHQRCSVVVTGGVIHGLHIVHRAPPGVALGRNVRTRLSLNT